MTLRRRFACRTLGIGLLIMAILVPGAFLIPSGSTLGEPSVAAQQKKGKKKTQKKKKKGKLPSTRRAPPERIAAVDPEQAERIAIGAARIDQLAEENYRKFGVTPNPMTTDEQFVRRIYLDITGTIPTYQQAKAFIDSRDPKKRARLIDRLLNSPGYVSHSFNYWGDILRMVDRPQPNVMGDPYIQWVKQALRDNMPYDVMVRSMLTAEGKIWEDPATGYLQRDGGMPLAAMDNTVRVFLGTRIGCAQCHDHPFDRWSRREFYEMAAFTFGAKTRLDRRDGIYKNGNPVQRLRAELQKIDPQNRGGGTFQRIIRFNMYAVKDDPRRKLRLPDDYAYSDGDPGDIVKPKVIFGQPAPEATTPRESFALWMTSKENPRFARTIANRLWKRVMGVGQIEPVDDMRDDSEPENKELMEYLTLVMTFLEFDLKEYQRVLYNTKTYQRQASTHQQAPDEAYHFPGPTLRRMTAEQVWDSLLTLAIYHPDGIRRPAVENVAQVAEMDLTNISAKDVLRKAGDFDERFGRKAIQDMRRSYSYKGQMLARASEQPMPVPAGHFLRQFGQGDRQLISGAVTDGSVPQLLTMFNGPVTHMMLEEGSVIYDNMLRARNANERIEVMFLSILGRRPTSSDRAVANREIKSRGNAGYGDVIWALINTQEFLFIQ